MNNEDAIKQLEIIKRNLKKVYSTLWSREMHEFKAKSIEAIEKAIDVLSK